MDFGNNNLWNNSDEEGNYWSDYTGVDNGANDRLAGDGIGDTKIPHPGAGCDYYPMMAFIYLPGIINPGLRILFWKKILILLSILQLFCLMTHIISIM
jgi:hypothetical protein